MGYHVIGGLVGENINHHERVIGTRCVGSAFYVKISV